MSNQIVLKKYQHFEGKTFENGSRLQRKCENVAKTNR